MRHFFVPQQLHYTKPCPPDTADLRDTVHSLFISSNNSSLWGHTSNWFLEYLPLGTPDGHAMVYCSLSSTSTITPSRFLGSPRPLSTAGVGCHIASFFSGCQHNTTVFDHPLGLLKLSISGEFSLGADGRYRHRFQWQLVNLGVDRQLVNLGVDRQLVSLGVDRQLVNLGVDRQLVSLDFFLN